MQAFLTLAERQFIVRNELDGLRAQRDLRVPGLPDNYTLHHRDNICEERLVLSSLPAPRPWWLMEEACPGVTVL